MRSWRIWFRSKWPKLLKGPSQPPPATDCMHPFEPQPKTRCQTHQIGGGGGGGWCNLARLQRRNPPLRSCVLICTDHVRFRPFAGDPDLPAPTKGEGPGPLPPSPGRCTAARPAFPPPLIPVATDPLPPFHGDAPCERKKGACGCLL